MNREFATVLSSIVSDDDVVWVHDYHLMLLPSFLRTPSSSKPPTKVTMKPFKATDEQYILLQMKIIFFMHIPFPTSQIFRTLPVSTSLLQSMVCADLVGFHAFDHARHFLNATKRLLGIKSYTRTGGMITLLVSRVT